MGTLGDLHVLTTPAVGDLLLTRDVSDVVDPDKVMTLATLAEHVNPRVVSALAYGVVADGSTDISALLQDAIDDVTADGGGTVWLPRATLSYKIDSGLILYSNVWLASNGATLDAEGMSASAIRAVGETNVRVSGLRLVGDGQSTLIRMSGCSHVRVENNDIDQTQTVDNTNVAAILIDDDDTDPAVYSDIWVVNNSIKAVFLGILAQSAQTGDPEMNGLFILGNRIDYINADTGTQSTSYGCGIKVDANIIDCVVSGNILNGRSLCRDGINVQEDLTNCVVSSNVVRNFTREGITVAAGQGVRACVNVIVANNVVHNMDDSVLANPSAQTPRAISINTSTNDNWRNISVVDNIVDGSGYGIYEDGSGASNRIINYVVHGNIVNNCDNVGIYARTHAASIRNNVVTTSASTICIQVVGSAVASAIIGNRIVNGGGSAIGNTGVGTITRDNIVNGELVVLNDSAAIVRQWVSGEYWSIEGVVTGISIATSATTTIDLGIDVLPFGTTTRGAYQVVCELAGGSSSSNHVVATFSAWMRMTDASTVLNQSGSFMTRSSTTITNAVTLDTDLTNFQVKITSTNASESMDNGILRFRLTKSANL